MKAILQNRIAQHIIFWCFYVLIYVGNYVQGDNYTRALVMTLLFLPTHIIFTYTQLYLLIPRLLLKKKIAAYLAVTLLVSFIFCDINTLYYSFVVYPTAWGIPCTYFKWPQLYTFNATQWRSVFSFFMICGIAVSVKLLKKWYYEYNRSQTIEKEKVTIELEMLKAQVHPHFLFNTLNNLYSLTLIKSDKAPLTVSHLSDLLRYMLYECNEKEVPLENEIAILKKYVELEKLRYGNRIDISFSCSGNSRQLKIAPLILLPFIENSFKHGVSEQLGQCWINLDMHCDGNTFTFNLSNSRNTDGKAKTFGGIGLHNIKKRLELIYPGNYSLQVNEASEMFSIKLQLQLSSLQQVVLTAQPAPVFTQPIPSVA